MGREKKEPQITRITQIVKVKEAVVAKPKENLRSPSRPKPSRRKCQAASYEKKKLKQKIAKNTKTKKATFRQAFFVLLPR